MRSAAVILVAILSITVGAAFASDPGGWWQKNDQGWFFYHDLPKKKEQKEEPRAASPSPQSSDKQLFSEKMRKKGEELLSKSLEYPTPENMKAYMEYNKLMLKMANNYSEAWQKVLMEHPDLMTGVPEGDNDKDIYYRITAEKNENSLRGLAQRAGLFFFYSSTCPYCRRQAQYLAQFMAKYPFFVVKAVSIDGGALPEFPNTVADNGIAERLGVETVPAIFLAFPPNRFDRISTGVLNPQAIERSLLLYDQKIDTDYSGAVSQP